MLAEANNSHKGDTDDENDYYAYSFDGKNISLTANSVYTWQIYFEGSQTTGWIDFQMPIHILVDMAIIVAIIIQMMIFYL